MIRSNQSLEECIRVVRCTGSSWGGRVDGYCDRFWPVSMWSLWLLWSLRSLRKKSSDDRWDCCRWDHWRVVSYDRCDRWSFFFSATAAMVVIIWKPGFNLIMAYFKRKVCLQPNLYLNCVSWKNLEGWWYRMVRLNKCNSLVECVDFSDLMGLLWAVYKFFRINNIGLKCSFVRCRKYHKSWWNGAADLHISVDLLCGTTAAELHNSVELIYFVAQRPPSFTTR